MSLFGKDSHNVTFNQILYRLAAQLDLVVRFQFGTVCFAMSCSSICHHSLPKVTDIRLQYSILISSVYIFLTEVFTVAEYSGLFDISSTLICIY